MNNLYWPIYKNLENELLEISKIVRVCDKQLSIFSDKILELLIRCAIEIESISKDLFILNGGTYTSRKDLYFDTTCLDFLENKWLLSKKKITVACANFYLSNKENIYLFPLKKANKRGSSGCDWKKSYQAIKHDRSNSMEKANIKNFIRALGALFILNLYYKNDTFIIQHPKDDSFQYTLSNIFSFSIHSQQGYNGDLYIKNSDFDECIYLTKWTDDTKEKFSVWNKELNNILIEKIINNEKINKHILTNFYINNNLDANKLNKFFTNYEYLNIIDKNTEFNNMLNMAIKETTRKLGFDLTKLAHGYEAIINKGCV